MTCYALTKYQKNTEYGTETKTDPLTDAITNSTHDKSTSWLCIEYHQLCEKMERERGYLMQNNTKLRQSLDDALSALRGLMRAEEATIDDFNAKEIDGLESAMNDARKVIDDHAPAAIGYSAEYEKMAAEIRDAMANGGTLSDINTMRRVLHSLHNVKVHTPLPASASDETGVKP